MTFKEAKELLKPGVEVYQTGGYRAIVVEYTGGDAALLQFVGLQGGYGGVLWCGIHHIYMEKCEIPL